MTIEGKAFQQRASARRSLGLGATDIPTSTAQGVMRVSHFMTPNPIACDETDSAYDVARLMRDKGIGFVVVLRKRKVVGVITDRQLAVGVMAEGLDARKVKAEDVMTAEPATARLDDNIFEVIDTMRSAGVVRRLPVVNASKELVGVVSVSDISVIAKDLIDAILMEDSRHALREVRLPSGGKAIQKQMRNPRKARAQKKSSLSSVSAVRTSAVRAPKRSGAPRTH